MSPRDVCQESGEVVPNIKFKRFLHFERERGRKERVEEGRLVFTTLRNTKLLYIFRANYNHNCATLVTLEGVQVENEKNYVQIFGTRYSGQRSIIRCSEISSASIYCTYH